MTTTQDLEQSHDDEYNNLMKVDSSDGKSSSDYASDEPLVVRSRTWLVKALSSLVIGAGMLAVVLIASNFKSPSQDMTVEAEGLAKIMTLEENDRTKGFYPLDGSLSLLTEEYGPKYVATENCSLLANGAELHEPEIVRSPVTLYLTTTKLCDPDPDHGTGQQWYVRAYSTDPNSPGTVPGPTIMAAPGENLSITVHNMLERPSKCVKTHVEAYPMYWDNPDFCFLNGTNLHTHGLHVSPRKGSDNVFEWARPGETLPVNFAIPPNHGAGTFWYHPHHHHSTSAQAGGGAHGAIIIEDPEESLPPAILAMPSKTIVMSLVNMQHNNTPGAGERLQFFFSPSMIEEQGQGGLWRNPASGEKNPPYTGEYVAKNAVYVLANGKHMPTLTIYESQFVRLRLILAATELALTWVPFAGPSDNNHICEMQLLAKDGVYLNEAPRRVQGIFLGSGNRADVALRCKCPSSSSGGCTGAVAAVVHLAGPGDSYWMYRDSHVALNPHKSIHRLNQTNNFLSANTNFLKLNITGGSKPDDPLPRFNPKRPCYLVDLTDADFTDLPSDRRDQIVTYPALLPGAETKNGIVTPTNPDPYSWHLVAHSTLKAPTNYTGAPFEMMEDDTNVFADSPNTEPIADLQVNSVYNLSISGNLMKADGKAAGGIAQHPVHLHITPFQIYQMRCRTPTDGNDGWVSQTMGSSCQHDAMPITESQTNDEGYEPYFQVGDWHDTLLYGGGRATIRFQTSTFAGPYVMHCHILGHEDGGMMGYVNVSSVAGTPGKPYFDDGYKGCFTGTYPSPGYYEAKK